MLSSPEIPIVGASVVDTSGGRVDTPQWPGVFGPAGVQEHGAGTRGLLGNLRAPSVSTDISGSGTGIPTPRPTTLRRVAGSKQDARVVSPSEATKCGERDGWESEYLIVATKRGNGPSQTRSEGGAVSRPASRNHAEGI
jgi:hypothetical protein